MREFWASAFQKHVDERLLFLLAYALGVLTTEFYLRLMPLL